MTPGEKAAEALDAPSALDIGLVMEKLTVSPTSQMLDHTSMHEDLETREDAFLDAHAGSEIVTQLNQFLVQDDEQKNDTILNSFEYVNIREPFSGGEEQICEPSCTSCRGCLGGKKIEQKIKSIKPSKYRRKLGKFSGIDFNSLTILRKTRSLSVKPARTSIWGSQFQIFPDVGKQKKPEVKSRNSKRKSSKGQSGKKSSGKKGTAARFQTVNAPSRDIKVPMRPISLKIKFGNRDCVNGNQEVANAAVGNEISELFENGCRVSQEMARDAVCVLARDAENVMPSDDFANVQINGVKSDRDVDPIACSKALISSMMSTENHMSDFGDSPDSEVMNSVPDASQCEYGLPKSQINSHILGASSADISSSVAPKKIPKKGNKKEVLFQEEIHTCTNGEISPESTAANGRMKPREKNEKSLKTKEPPKNIVSDQHHVIETISASGTQSRIDNHLKTVEYRSNTKRNAWVLCDDCQKWRRISSVLADQIEEKDSGWTCKDNMDKEFADCSVPQEKSDSEINEELELSDGSCEEDAQSNLVNIHNDSKVADQPSWWPIKLNLFLHRKRKTQTIDEVMVCHCKPPSDGKMGCGAKCLNRMLNIECVRGTCPCGNLCSNQQFQKRTYAKLKWIRCGKKGYGLQAVEDISEGRFLIEYVGEVLDMHAYDARQRDYAMKGHKHFYFMTLNGSEVIDACIKGNLGRFINHSCEPNCRTEKWMVNGEVCVGLFALRDIRKGEEVTFDYNYVRVFGAAAKKCVCGSINCRGYIGGDPTNTELVVQDDSDEEYNESVVICEDKKISEVSKQSMPNLPRQEVSLKSQPTKKQSTKKSRSSTAKSAAKIDGFNFAESAVNADQKIVGLKCSTGADVATKIKGLDRKLSEDSIDQADFGIKSQEVEKKICSSPSLARSSPSLSVSPESNRISEQSPSVARVPEIKRPNVPTKTRVPSVPIKRRQKKVNSGNENGTPEVSKLNAPVGKSKNMFEFSLNSHFEAVEQKLNILLDDEGGISKRKDASRGYLKLLFLTAASESGGDGEAIQSNRDLSMILDALLKTKSRSVLVDIINKNGMQMLHNIMKRYRKEFIKTPILRKLLKVLEYLAMRNILTLEHIVGGPRCPGVESFKDSMLTLTEHADKQVHQIARSFRDRWIPKPLRRKMCIDRDDGRHQRSSRGASVGSSHFVNDRSGRSTGTEMQAQSVAASGKSGTSSTVSLPTSTRNCAPDGTRIRKRKSRWDCPAEDFPNSKIRTSVGGEEMVNDSSDFPPGFSSCNGSIPTPAAAPVASSDQERLNIDSTPPGFPSPCNLPVIGGGATSPAAINKEISMQVKDSSDSISLNNMVDDVKLNIDKDMPPGFSSPCNVPLLCAGSASSTMMDKGMPVHVKDGPDLGSISNLADDENVNVEDDMPPGFSSRNLPVVPCGTASFGLPERELYSQEYQQLVDSSNFTREDWRKSYDGFQPSFSSPAGHSMSPSAPATDNHQQSDAMSEDDDAPPPGFSSPCRDPAACVPLTAKNCQEKATGMVPCSAVSGEFQLNFNAQMSLSYGVPYSVIQLFGMRRAEDWIKAPGVPFYPYPPTTSACSTGNQGVPVAGCASLDEDAEDSEQRCSTPGHRNDETYIDTSSMDMLPKKYLCVENTRQDDHHGYSSKLGRRYFRQQKGNQPKLPPWVRMRNGWSHSSARNGF